MLVERSRFPDIVLSGAPLRRRGVVAFGVTEEGNLACYLNEQLVGEIGRAHV